MNGTPLDMVAAILEHYDAASAVEANEGAAWYTEARNLATTLGRSVGAERAAGVLAALSPRVQWNTNKAAAATMLSAAMTSRVMPIVAGIPRNRVKAWKIATGADPDAILGGSKVRSFYANILGDEDAVTVDVWALRTAGVEGTDSLGDKTYAAVADAYRIAAGLRGITPMVMQATTWIHVRNIARES